MENIFQSTTSQHQLNRAFGLKGKLTDELTVFLHTNTPRSTKTVEVELPSPVLSLWSSMFTHFEQLQFIILGNIPQFIKLWLVL